MQRTYVALDIETTGLDPQHDAITEIGAVKFRGSEVLETWSSLVNPQRPIPYHIQRLTGIKQEEADSAPSLFALLPPLSRFVGHHPLVGHNIAFDLSFLRRHGVLLDRPAIDTFQLATILAIYVPGYSLSALAQSLGVKVEEAHRALADAKATKELFLTLWERALSLDLRTIQEINRLAEGSPWPFRQLFLDVERERSRSAFVGSIRERLAAQEGSLLSPLVLEGKGEWLQPSTVLRLLDIDLLSAMVEPGGLLESHLPHYEYRPRQVEMLKGVARTLNEGGHLLLEAGTGVGKSLAYLLPGIHFAVENGQHLVVSTNTINLQDQLFKKDIPDLERMLPLEFEAALLKGRSNYLCLRKLAHLRLRGGLSEAEIGLLAKILVWLPSTVSGDQAELNLVEEEQRIWARLSAEEPCEAERCPHFERCFFYRARRRAEAAHLIVVNHSLLLSDMMTENRVLPRYSHLIIDEAHHLEDRATEQLSVEVGQRWLYFLLDGIASGSGRGLLNYLPLFLKGASSPFRREVEGYAADLKEEVARTRGTMEAFLSALSTFLNQHRRGNGRYDEHIRLTSALRAQPGWAQVEIAWEPLSSRLARIAQGLETLHQGVMSLGEREKHEDLLLELAQSGQEVHNLKEELEAIIAQPSPERIYWATMAARDKSLSLHDAPRQVAPLLWERLLSPQESLILTSATLRTGEGFAYIRERLGLEGAEEMALGSPFNYGDSTLLFIPTDIPEPNAPGYLQAAQEALWALSLATQGRILVLFTSWADLRSTHEALAGPLAERGIQLLGQGIDGSRHLVLEGFRAHPKSVLLGTRSFWEGIDVMGEALSCLVMARLPFPVPDDPIIAARSESYEDPFGQYHLPQAVLRFRQGFGRLIRSKSDRGVVVVLDKRMVTKYYGATFLASLPDCTIQQGSVTELPQVAAQWINRPKE